MIKNFFYYVMSFCITLSLVSHVCAQTTITATCHKPIIGDRLARSHIEGINAIDKGDSVIWDFSASNILDDNVVLRFSFDSLGFRSIEPGLKTYYCQADDTLMVRAYRTTLESINYGKPLVSMVYPLQYGDSIYSNFQGNGKYCGTYNLSHFGTTIIKADAQGCIILPDKKVLSKVLQVHTITYKNIQLEGMEANLVDTATAKQELTEKYQWYVKSCRYPVIEYTIGTSYNDGTQIASQSQAYCFLPDSLMEMTTSVDDMYMSTNDDGRSLSGYDNGDINIPMEYTVSQSGNVINLSYTTTSDASVTFILAGTMGMVYETHNYKCSANEHYQTTFNCNGYKPGGYIIYIKVNGIVTSEKFQVK